MGEACYPVHRGLFSSISDIYPLDASSNPQVWEWKVFADIVKYPLGQRGKITLWLRPTVLDKLQLVYELHLTLICQHGQISLAHHLLFIVNLGWSHSARGLVDACMAFHITLCTWQELAAIYNEDHGVNASSAQWKDLAFICECRRGGCHFW